MVDTSTGEVVRRFAVQPDVDCGTECSYQNVRDLSLKTPARDKLYDSNNLSHLQAKTNHTLKEV